MRTGFVAQGLTDGLGLANPGPSGDRVLASLETLVICPHCQQTIREEQKQLMTRYPDAPIPNWLFTAAGIGIAFVLIVALLTSQAA